MRPSFLQILRPMDQGWVPLGPAIEESQSSTVALFRSAIATLFPVNLFNYENRKMLQRVAFRVKMSSYWFCQTLMFNIRSMAIHPYVELILRFSNILFVTFCTFDHICHIGCFAVCRGFDWIHFPSGWALKLLYCFDVITGLTKCLLTPGIPLVRRMLFLFGYGPH